MNTFPRARRSRTGYDPDEVERFLQKARDAYDADPVQDVSLTSRDIRRTAFSMKKGGYSTGHVDAALERLEDAFAARERDRANTRAAGDAWIDAARTTAQVVLNRLERPSGRKFDRTGILTTGYNRQEVDRFAGRLSRYFQDGAAVTVEEVRTIVFRPQRRGYREAQVDLLLDSVTDVMLAVR